MTRARLVNCSASNKSVTSHNYGKTIYKRVNAEIGVFHREKSQRIGSDDSRYYEPCNFYGVREKPRYKNSKKRKHIIKGFIGFDKYDTYIVDGVMKKIKHKPIVSNNIPEKPQTIDKIIHTDISGKKTVRIKCKHIPEYKPKQSKESIINSIFN